jgi:cytochrome b
VLSLSQKPLKTIRQCIHIMIGLGLVVTALLRIVWGFIGSRYAKFSSFALKPYDLLRYFKDLLTSKTLKKLGHNPASSWAALAMIMLSLGLGFTGIMMAQDINKDFYEDIHELCGNVFIIIAAGHVLGIIIHTLGHKDKIGLSMVHGCKKSIVGDVGIVKSHAKIGFLFVAILISFFIYLNKNYNTTQRSLNIGGITLQLGNGPY